MKDKDFMHILNESLQLRLLLDDYFESQLSAVVHALGARGRRPRYSGIEVTLTDLRTLGNTSTPAQVNERCWRILLCEDYFVDSTNHLVVRDEDGTFRRLDWHTLPPLTVLDLFGKLRLMEFALQRS